MKTKVFTPARGESAALDLEPACRSRFLAERINEYIDHNELGLALEQMVEALDEAGKTPG
jgi:hypothetical protein